jgi:hypothetical protein
VGLVGHVCGPHWGTSEWGGEAALRILFVVLHEDSPLQLQAPPHPHLSKPLSALHRTLN